MKKIKIYLYCIISFYSKNLKSGASWLEGDDRRAAEKKNYL